ncbi:dienelactone hydrolase family protein [Streptomyces sp. DSM 40750]|uniref:dienelactone hydrolase family protein n=1 Tax=Streptomyces sp. DSM 40750 TaxID=2801030 RepID=UPI002F415D00
MPDLYTAGGARRCLIPTMRAALSGHGRAYQDIAAARTHLVDDPDCTGAVGIIGFCMGGFFALMAAGSGIFDATSANYDQPPRTWTRPWPTPVGSSPATEAATDSSRERRPGSTPPSTGSASYTT